MRPHPRALFLCWQSPGNRAIYPIGRLVRTSAQPRYEFTYVRGVLDAQAQGFVAFPEMTELRVAYRFAELPPLFTNRVMSPSRPDFPGHLLRLGLSDLESVAPEPEAILARSEGRKATDHLEITASPEFEPTTRSWIYYGFARGVRHVPGAEGALQGVHAGDRLQVERDLTNAWDARAMLVLRTDRLRLGFVPHLLIEDLGWVLDHDGEVQAEVVRVNLPPAPVHQRLLVVFKVVHQAGFVPMATPQFQPMAEDAVQLNLAAAADLHPA